MATLTKTREMEALLARALQAGQEAAEAAVPTPMVVYETQGLSDLPKPGGKTYFVQGGVCGFAGVIIKPAKGSFVQLLKAKGLGYKHYYGGYYLPARPRVEGPLCQSLEIAEAFARGVAKVLREAGLTVSVDSRMD